MYIEISICWDVCIIYIICKRLERSENTISGTCNRNRWNFFSFVLIFSLYLLHVTATTWVGARVPFSGWQRQRRRWYQKQPIKWGGLNYSIRINIYIYILYHSIRVGIGWLCVRNGGVVRAPDHWKTEVCWWQPGNERTLVTPLFSFRFALTIILHQIIL